MVIPSMVIIYRFWPIPIWVLNIKKKYLKRSWTSGSSVFLRHDQLMPVPRACGSYPSGHLHVLNNSIAAIANGWSLKKWPVFKIPVSSFIMDVPTEVLNTFPLSQLCWGSIFPILCTWLPNGPFKVLILKWVIMMVVSLAGVEEYPKHSKTISQLTTIYMYPQFCCLKMNVGGNIILLLNSWVHNKRYKNWDWIITWWLGDLAYVLFCGLGWWSNWHLLWRKMNKPRFGWPRDLNGDRRKRPWCSMSCDVAPPSTLCMRGWASGFRVTILNSSQRSSMMICKGRVPQTIGKWFRVNNNITRN